ncbi:MAG: proline/glycine betaine ABC transporter permease [Actinomycetota bacterium]|nr:proline/glycine betaine ABC transporter permease [Actinomycetota bacterium]
MLALLQQDLVPDIPLDDWTSAFVKYVRSFEIIDEFFDVLTGTIRAFVGTFEALLNAPPELVMVAILTVIAFILSGWRVALFGVIGFVLLIGMGLWEQAMLSLALVLASAIVALAIGVPIGILAAKSSILEGAARPTLDVMQTMPAFVYLVPMVVFLGLGSGPGLVATVIFATPPAVRLTLLGLQQVPQDTVEAAQAFGATPWQTLRKVELPQALPTIMAGVNQVIMLALSMVVIAALVGAGGLGETVVRGLSQLDVGRAFIGGVGIVIIAIYLDRVTRSLGRGPQQEGGGIRRRLRLGKKGASKVLPGTRAGRDTVGAGTDKEADAEDRA